MNSTSPTFHINRKSHLREKLAARNGSRHSVYWVKPMKKKTDTSKSMDSSSTIEYTLVGTYTGEWKDGQKHGFGVFVYPNGNKYEGEWVADKRQGRGIYWIKKNQKLWKQYTGEWLKDSRHGHGTFFHQDGGKYEGAWRNHNRHGYGRRVYSEDESMYEGEWVCNKRYGHGTFVKANGDRYVGHWMNDKKEGPGRYFYKATRKLYEGEWVDDTPKCGTYHDIDPEDDQVDDGGKNHNHFQLPELELSHPEQVLREVVADIRQIRVQEGAFNEKVDQDATFGRSLMGADKQEPDVAIFDNHMMRQIQSGFHALLAAESTDIANKQQHGCISCSFLPNLIKRLEFNVKDERLAQLLQEIGATFDTLVSFDECVDILSLLVENHENPLLKDELHNH